MKKVLMVMALVAICVSTQAQVRRTQNANVGEWESVYFQYNPSTMVNGYSGGDDQSFTGLTIGYNKAISISTQSPLFLEVGAAAQYNFVSKDGRLFDDDDDDEDFKVTWTMASVKVPVSLTYNWQVSPTVVIAPYGGLTVRFNIFGNLKAEDDYDDESVSIFDKKEMGGKDGVYKRFQLGWQIGANVKFNNSWYLGASYGSDFSEVTKKVKIAQPALTIGMIL